MFGGDEERATNCARHSYESYVFCHLGHNKNFSHLGGNWEESEKGRPWEGEREGGNREVSTFN